MDEAHYVALKMSIHTRVHTHTLSNSKEVKTACFIKRKEEFVWSHLSQLRMRVAFTASNV